MHICKLDMMYFYSKSISRQASLQDQYLQAQALCLHPSQNCSGEFQKGRNYYDKKIWGKDVNHKKKKERISLWQRSLIFFTVWTWAIGHSQNQRSRRPTNAKETTEKNTLAASRSRAYHNRAQISSERSPCGQNKSAGIFTPSLETFFLMVQ